MEIPAKAQVRVNVAWLWVVAVETLNSRYVWQAEVTDLLRDWMWDVGEREKPRWLQSFELGHWKHGAPTDWTTMSM